MQLVTCPMSNFTCATVAHQEQSKQSSRKMASMVATDFINCVEMESFLCTNTCKSRPLPQSRVTGLSLSQF